MPRISVGLPVYNGERHLPVALESVLAQTCGDFELVICDNASTDGTEAICREFAARDPRVRYIRNAVNIGAAENFRRVFDLATAEYYRWLAADDFMSPTSLERCLVVLESRPEVVLCCSKVNIVDDQGQIMHRYEVPQALEQPRAVDRFRAVFEQYGWCNAVYGLMRREVARRTRLLGSFTGSDCVFLAEMCLYGQFAEVPEYLFSRRSHPQAYSYNWSRERDRMFYAPQSRRKPSLLLYTWRHLYEHVRAIQRAPLSPADRIVLLVRVVRMAWWKKRLLVNELWAAARAATAR